MGLLAFQGQTCTQSQASLGVEWLKGILGRVGTKAGRSTSILRMGDGSVAWAGGQREMKGPSLQDIEGHAKKLVLLAEHDC